jgi:hypothetical protein
MKYVWVAVFCAGCGGVPFAPMLGESDPGSDSGGQSDAGVLTTGVGSSDAAGLDSPPFSSLDAGMGTDGEPMDSGLALCCESADGGFTPRCRLGSDPINDPNAPVSICQTAAAPGDSCVWAPNEYAGLQPGTVEVCR